MKLSNLLHAGTLCIASFALAACASHSQPSVPQPVQPSRDSAPKADFHEASRINADMSIEYLKEGRIEIALEKAKKALQQDPDNASAHTAMALVYAQRADPEHAEAEFREAVSLDPKNSEAKNTFGVFLCKQNKNAEGLRLLESAAEDRAFARPEGAWTNAGVCAQAAHAADSGEHYFQNALQIDPGYADALSQMAMITYRRGDYPQALGFAQRFERVAPMTPDTLMIAAICEQKLGKPSLAQRYQDQLFRKFPESTQTAEVLKASRP